MRSALAPVSALLLSVAFLLMGNGLQSTLLPLRADFEVFTKFEIGVLGSAYYLGFAAGCLYGAHVIRRVGHIRTFTAVVAVASAVALAHALVLNPYAWWLLRALTGFCVAVLFMVIESWLNERATNENRGLVFSVYAMINLTVISLGQLMLTLDDPGDFPLFSIASILVSLAAVPVAMTKSQAPAPVATVRIRFRYLYGLSPVGFIGCLSVGMANGALWGLGPVFARTFGESTTLVALFMSVVVVSGALGQWPLGRLSDRLDRRRVIALGCGCAALAGLGLLLLPRLWDWSLLPLAAAYGFFALPVYALSVANMNDFVAPDGFVEASSGLLLVFATGAATGPVLASLIIWLSDEASLFGFTACVHLAMAAFALYRRRRRERAPEAERAVFAEAQVAAQTLSPIDLQPVEPSQDETGVEEPGSR